MTEPYKTFDEVLNALFEAEQNFSAEQRKCDLLMNFIIENGDYDKLMEYMKANQQKKSD